MRRLCTAFTLLCAATAASTSLGQAQQAPQPAQQACPPLKQVGVIKLERTDRGLWLVPVTINGKPMKLKFQTGAPTTTLTSAAAKTLGLKSFQKAGQGFYTYGSAVSLGFVNVGALVLDNVGQFNNSDLMLMNLPTIGGTSTDDEAAGELGLDILTHFDFDMDFSTGTVNLFSLNHCDGQVVYWKTAGAVAIPFQYDTLGRIRVEVKLDGTVYGPMTATFSSFNQHNGLSTGFADYYFNFKKLDAEKVPNEEGWANITYRHRFGTLDLGGLQIGNFAMDVWDYKPLGSGGYQSDHFLKKSLDPSFGVSQLPHKVVEPAILEVGLDTMSKLHIYVASKEHKLYISPAGQ